MSNFVRVDMGTETEEEAKENEFLSSVASQLDTDVLSLLRPKESDKALKEKGKILKKEEKKQKKEEKMAVKEEKKEEKKKYKNEKLAIKEEKKARKRTKESDIEVGSEPTDELLFSVAEDLDVHQNWRVSRILAGTRRKFRKMMRYNG